MMRRTLTALALIFAAALAPAGCASGSERQQKDPFAAIPRVSVEELAKALEEKRAVVVDVRPEEAYEEEHIAGAYSIPEEEVRARAGGLPPGKLVVTYCA